MVAYGSQLLVQLSCFVSWLFVTTTFLHGFFFFFPPNVFVCYVVCKWFVIATTQTSLINLYLNFSFGFFGNIVKICFEFCASVLSFFFYGENIYAVTTMIFLFFNVNFHFSFLFQFVSNVYYLLSDSVQFNVSFLQCLFLVLLFLHK
jgi:hypothetical protein